MSQTELSIIIPTYNTRDLTLRCLKRIFENPPACLHEILVVDNHSSDATVQDVRTQFKTVQVLTNEANLGFSRACNRGASHANGRYLLFLNSDTEAQAGTFDTLIDWMNKHPKTAIVGPKLLGADEKLLQMSWVWNPLMEGELIQQFFAPYAIRKSPMKQRLVHFLQRKSASVPSICGACLMIRREAFDQIHGFDEEFELYFEDSDLCLRCKESGWKIDFVAESKIVHHLGQSTHGSWHDTSLIYQQSHIDFYRKHAPLWAVYLLKFYLLLKWIRLRWFSHPAPQEHARATAYCRAYLCMIQEKGRITLEDGIPS